MNKFYLFFILFLFIFLFLFVFLANKSFGAEIKNFDDWSQCSNSVAGPASYPSFNRVFAFPFKLDSDINLNSISFKYSGADFSGNAVLYSTSLSNENNQNYYFIEDPNNDMTSPLKIKNQNLDFVSTSTSFSFDSGIFTINFNNVFLSSSNYYVLFLYYNTGGNTYTNIFYNYKLNTNYPFYNYNVNYFISEFSGNFPELSNGWVASPVDWSDNLKKYNLCYSINYSPSYIGTSISVENPASTMTYFENSDFSNFFKVNFYLNQSDIFPFQDSFIKIGYTLSKKNNFGTYTTYSLKQYKIFYNNLNVPGYNTLFFDAPPLFSGDYRLDFYMITDTDTYLADSIYFSVMSSFFTTSTTSTISINPDSLITAPECSFLECPGDWFGYGINKAFTYLFIPNQNQINIIYSNISNIKTSFESAFPFKYYFQIYDFISSTTQSIADNSSNYSFKIKFLNKEYNVISTSTISNILGSDNYYLLRQYLGYGIYIISALLVISIL